MKTLNLYRTWEVLNKISHEQSVLSDDDVFVELLGQSSNYTQTSFERFLEFYSFKIESDTIIIFNDDGVPYENYTNSDFSYLPINLLVFTEFEMEEWVKNKVQNMKKNKIERKLQDFEQKKQEIKRLQKEIDDFSIDN